MKQIQYQDEDKVFDQQAAALIKKQQQEKIEGFFGQYFSFLHNDTPSLVYYDGFIFPSVNTAFHSARSQDLQIKERLSNVDSIEEMINIAQEIEDPPNWQRDRLRIMEILIRDKFMRDRELRERLKQTKRRILINTYQEKTESNLFWGKIAGQGQNQLGRILEEVRQDIEDGIDQEKWILFCLNLEKDKSMYPVLKFSVQKDGQEVESFELKDKNYYIFGNLKGSDVICRHPSVSKKHACIFLDQDQNINLVDLNSKAGTFVNNEQIQIMVPRVLKEGDSLALALSTRNYQITVDYSGVMKKLEQQTNEMKKELTVLDRINDPNISTEELKNILGFALEDSIYISNLPYNVAQQELREKFEQFGKIKEIKIPIDRITGKQRSIALITYVDQKDAQKAQVKGDRMEYQDKKLSVVLADKTLIRNIMENTNRRNNQNQNQTKQNQNQNQRNENQINQQNNNSNYKRRFDEYNSQKNKQEIKTKKYSRSRSKDNKKTLKNHKNKFKSQERVKNRSRSRSKKDKKERKHSKEKKQKENSKEKQNSKENKDVKKKENSKEKQKENSEKQKIKENSKERKTKDKSKEKKKKEQSKSKEKKNKEKSKERKNKEQSKERKKSKDRKKEKSKERKQDSKNDKKKDKSRSRSRDKKKEKESEKKKVKSRDRKKEKSKDKKKQKEIKKEQSNQPANNQIDIDKLIHDHDTKNNLNIIEQIKKQTSEPSQSSHSKSRDSNSLNSLSMEK